MVDVDLGHAEGVRVSHLKRTGVERHVSVFLISMRIKEGPQQFGIHYISTLILEDLVDGIGDLVIPEEIVLDIVTLIGIVLGKVSQLRHKDVLLVLSHPVYFLLFAHQELAVFLHSFLLGDGIQAIVFSWEVDSPRIVGHLAVGIFFVADCGFIREDEDHQTQAG